jgi:hypothetical protein
MADADPPPEMSRTKIRIGLALISLVVIAALVLVFLIEAPAGKAVMFAIAATAFVRAFLLSRSLRRERRA